MAQLIPSNGQTRVNITTTGQQYDAAVAALGPGGFVIAWDDNDRGDVFARLFDSAGNPVGSEIQANITTTTGTQFFPTVAGLEGGGFVIAWQSGSLSNANILAQRFDAAGLPLGSEITVTNAPNEQLNARATGLDGGGFLITWDTISGGQYQEVQGQIYSASGDPAGTPFVVNTVTTDQQGISSIVGLEGGGFLVVWQSILIAGSNNAEIVAQRFNALGTKVGVEFQVNTTTASSEFGEDVALLDEGAFVVSWVRPSGGNNATGQILARTYDVSGNAIGDEITVFTEATESLGGTSITALPGGEFLVAWQVGNGSANRVMAQVIAADGGALGSAFTVNQSIQDFPVLTSDGTGTLTNGNVVVSWDGPTTSTDQDIYFRYYQVTASQSPTITSNGGGATAAIAIAENTTPVTTVTATDPDGPSLSFAIVGGTDQGLFRIDAATGLLSFIAAPDFEHPGDAGANNFYEVTVQASDGSLTDTQAITVSVTDVNETGPGSPGDDDVIAPLGTSQFDGSTGIDTITFAFALVDASFTWSGNQVTVDTASSHTVLTGFERFVFTDGTVENNDSDALVDDLFYFARNHDVWNAQLDAEQHFNEWGWRENRDPNAFFDTSLYRDLNVDVNAAGVNPLAHFHQSGWMEGRIPSLAFDPRKYLAANPDVAATQIDPLEHFLRNGAQEGRQPFAATTVPGSNGFDVAYYLQTNPDVAAAGLDPWQHFQTVGWQEGRNPNALFDIRGYLATYTDVAAAGVNPLEHYHQYGWEEGRDPSIGFDTSAYLAAYSDVAAAHIDPLVHYLVFGQNEGRSTFADGIWG